MLLFYADFYGGSGSGASARKLTHVASTDEPRKDVVEIPGISYAEADQALKDQAIANELPTDISVSYPEGGEQCTSGTEPQKSQPVEE